MVALAVLGSPAAVQAQYTKLTVKGRVELEVPDTWSISDVEQRKRVRDLAASLMGKVDVHVSALSVQSFPPPAKVYVRVSLLKLYPPITQSELHQEVQADAKQVVADLAETWTADAPAMWAALGSKGIREVGRPSFAVEPLGGQMAMVVRYGRTSPNKPEVTMRVVQYHVPLGAEEVLVTLTHVEANADAAAAQERVRKSIVIR